MSPRLHPSIPAGFERAFVERTLDDALAHQARVYAIAGLQGTGKSTLVAQVASLARSRGLRVATLSIDDVYLGRRQRQQLARQVHPLLATRGPPGTHEVALACAVLDDLREGRPVRLPRFDKLADTRTRPSRWPVVDAVDLVLFDGWFLKAPAQSAQELVAPINAVEAQEDKQGVWRTYCNDALGRDYPALWNRFDRLLFLQPPGFANVPDWRWQQERALRASRRQQRAMTRPQLERFVQLFERVSRQSLRYLPALADLTQPVDAQRRPL
jgi:D-glycerate 3-kinase